MKKTLETKSKTLKETLNSLFQLETLLKNLRVEAKSVKDELKSKYSEYGRIISDDIYVLISEKDRESVSIKELREKLGKEAEQFIKRSHYKSISIKKIA